MQLPSWRWGSALAARQNQAFAYKAQPATVCFRRRFYCRRSRPAMSSTSGPIPCRKLPRALAAAPGKSNFTAVYDKTITDRPRRRRRGNLEPARPGSPEGTWSAMQDLRHRDQIPGDRRSAPRISADARPRPRIRRHRERCASAPSFASGATTPRVYFGKGLGDLDIGYLRPLAVAGLVGYQIADLPPRPLIWSPRDLSSNTRSPTSNRRCKASTDLPECVRGTDADDRSHVHDPRRAKLRGADDGADRPRAQLCRRRLGIRDRGAGAREPGNRQRESAPSRSSICRSISLAPEDDRPALVCRTMTRSAKCP